jgi:trypanothione synthetase/amidase
MFIQKPDEVPYGTIQGYAPGGIPFYSNGSDWNFTAEREYVDGVFTGVNYQCVQGCRRWLLERKGLFLPDVHFAAHIFTVTEMDDIETGKPVRTVPVKNNGKDAPTVDSLLIYPSSDDYPPGHIAAIVEVGEGFVRIADQNNTFKIWPGKYYSDELTVTKDENGNYCLKDHQGRVPLGWVTFPDTPNRPDGSKHLTNVHPKFKEHNHPKYELERVEFQPKPVEGPWLDTSDPAIKKFVEVYGVDLSRTRLEESKSNYYKINIESWFALTRAGFQLHNMCIKATERVLKDDSLLKLFGIPEELWPRLKKSFERCPYQITGRFDFVFNADGTKLKMFEYNADSASTLLECGVIQDKWAAAVGLDQEGTRSAGFRLDSLLGKAWQDVVDIGCIPKGSKVHFLVDNDGEEEYTALYPAGKAQKAGLETELVVMFDSLKLGEDGHVYDKEGKQVKYVWKTWNWETGIKDWKLSKTRKRERPDQVFLSDILFNEHDDIIIFEPMWKLVPGNKAILPILWEMFPEHPNLLRTEWKVTDELRKSGYARKPIVGRTGQNITIVSAEVDGKPGEVLGESEGNYSDRDLVYQELFPIAKRGDYYGIIGGWVCGAYYAGAGVREDKSIITNLDSPFSAIRIQFTGNVKQVTHDNVDEESEKINNQKKAEEAK